MLSHGDFVFRKVKPVSILGQQNSPYGYVKRGKEHLINLHLVSTFKDVWLLAFSDPSIREYLKNL